MKTMALAAIVALAACTGQNGASSKAASNAAPKTAAIGQPAPQWTEPTVTGGSMTMASLAGKPVWLSFFATWCPPCNEEAPSVNAVYKELSPRGLQVVGVDVLENAAKAKQFTDQHQLSYPAVVDSGTLRDAYEINGMPVNVFIDKTGTVRKIEIGELSKEEMEADAHSIL